MSDIFSETGKSAVKWIWKKISKNPVKNFRKLIRKGNENKIRAFLFRVMNNSDDYSILVEKLNLIIKDTGSPLNIVKFYIGKNKNDNGNGGYFPTGNNGMKYKIKGKDCNVEQYLDFIDSLL